MKGKRAKPLPAPVFKANDRVLGEYSGKIKAGVIEEITGVVARIKFDTGKIASLHIKSLTFAPRDNDEDDPEDEEGLSGFNQYTIKWADENTHFHFDVEGVHFYGWFRKTENNHDKEICWAVDLFAKFDNRSYAIRSIGYYTADPRNNLRSLNADLCVAANDWFWQRCKGSTETINDLERRANRPQVKINSLETIDRILLRLREVRDTCIYAAGKRHFQIKGDDDKDVVLGLEIDLSKQSFLLKGKVPPLNAYGIGAASIIDSVDTVQKKSKPSAERAAEYAPASQNVKDLVALLAKTRDKSEARKIRAALRKMGHQGGARAMKEE